MSEIDISILFDPVCPWCYVGKKRLEKAMGERPQYQFAVSYLPFQLNPGMPQEGMDRKTYLSHKFGGDEGARMAYAPLQQAAEDLELGFRLQNIAIMPNSTKAHILLQYLQWREYSPNYTPKYTHVLCDVFVEALFRAFFCDGKNIGDTAVLAELWSAQDIGDLPDIDNLPHYDSYLTYVTESQNAALQAQVNGVPFYIIGGQHSLSGAQEPHVFLPIFDLAFQSKS